MKKPVALLLALILLCAACSKEAEEPVPAPETADPIPAPVIAEPARAQLRLDLERLGVGTVSQVLPLTERVVAMGVQASRFPQFLLVDITTGRVLNEIGLTGALIGLSLLSEGEQPPFLLTDGSGGEIRVDENWQMTFAHEQDVPDRFTDEENKILVDGQVVLEGPGYQLLYLPETDHRLVYFYPGGYDDDGNWTDVYCLYDTLTGESRVLADDGRQMLARIGGSFLLGRQEGQGSGMYDLSLLDPNSGKELPITRNHDSEENAIDDWCFNGDSTRMSVTWIKEGMQYVEIYDLETGLLRYDWAAPAVSRYDFRPVGRDKLLVHCREGDVLWLVEY